MAKRTKKRVKKENSQGIKKCKANEVPNKELFETYNFLQRLKNKQEEMIKQLEHIKKSESTTPRIKAILVTSEIKIKETEERINTIKHALINNIKGFIAYKRTESELGAYNKSNKFIERFIMILTEPNLSENNDLENLMKEIYEKYDLHFAN